MRRWLGTSAACGDYDNDGFVDLYVANYIDFDPQPRRCQARASPASTARTRTPRSCAARVDSRANATASITTPATERSPTSPSGAGSTGTATAGWAWSGATSTTTVYPDILVANDAQPNLLYRNNGTARSEVALDAGVAVDEDGRERAGMGVDLADYNNDGWLDVAIANFYGEPHSLYRNQKNGSFLETTWASGIGRPRCLLSWGTRFLDYDNDGWKDLAVVNGHVYPEVDRHSSTRRTPNRRCCSATTGTAPSPTSASVGGAGATTPAGAAVGDYDNDGDLDVLIATVNASPCSAPEQRWQSDTG